MTGLKEPVRKTYKYYVTNNLPVPEGVVPWGQKQYANGKFAGGKEAPTITRQADPAAIPAPKTVVHLPSPSSIPPKPVVEETDEQIDKKLRERFRILGQLVQLVLNGGLRSLVISGPPGLGKSHTVEEALAAYDPSEQRYTAIKGTVLATGLYKTLYEYRHPGNVVVFDDADSVFGDERSLNILKAVSDTGKKRFVSWLTEAILLDSNGAQMPRNFEFQGAIIFITNYDFDRFIGSKSKLAPHFQALQDRAQYLDLAMHNSMRERLIRIRQVVEEGMLNETGLGKSQQDEVMAFLETNLADLRDLSLRTTLKLAGLRKLDDWENTARITLLKQK